MNTPRLNQFFIELEVKSEDEAATILSQRPLFVFKYTVLMDPYIELKYLLESPFGEIFVGFPRLPLYVFRMKLPISVYIES